MNKKIIQNVSQQYTEIKSKHDDPIIRDNVRKKLDKIKFPLITVHIDPDSDADGSAIAMYYYFQLIGSTPTIYLNPDNVYPEYLSTTFSNMNIINKIEKKHPFDAIIHLDTLMKEHMEPVIIDLRANKDLMLVEIDHHYGSLGLAPKGNSIINDLWYSNCGLLMDFLFSDIQLPPNIAMAIQAGILSDIQNGYAWVNKNTQDILTKLNDITQVGHDKLFGQTHQFSWEQEEIINKVLKSMNKQESIIDGKKYSLGIIITTDKVHSSQLLKKMQPEADILILAYPKRGQFGIKLIWGDSLAEQNKFIDFRELVAKYKKGTLLLHNIHFLSGIDISSNKVDNFVYNQLIPEIADTVTIKDIP